MPSIDERLFEEIGWRPFLRRHPGHPAAWLAVDVFIAVLVFGLVFGVVSTATAWSTTTTTVVAGVPGVLTIALGAWDAFRRRDAGQATAGSVLHARGS